MANEDPKKKKAYNKAYYQQNKEEINKKHKQYCEANREKYNEYQREYKKQYYRQNKEKIKEWRKQYYQCNKEKINEIHKKYCHNNKDKVKEYNRKYRETHKGYCAELSIENALKRNNESRLTAHNSKKLWTQKEISLLKQLTLQNVPPHEIDKNPNLHKTRSAICNKLHVLRANNEIPSSSLRIDGWTHEDDDIIIQMFNNKETPEQIAAKLNRTKSAVNHRICRLRAEKKLPPEDKTILHSTGQKSIWTGREEDVETLKRLIKEGYRVKDMLSHLSHEYTYAQVAGKVNHLKNLKKSNPL